MKFSTAVLALAIPASVSSQPFQYKRGSRVLSGQILLYDGFCPQFFGAGARTVRWEEDIKTIPENLVQDSVKLMVGNHTRGKMWSYQVYKNEKDRGIVPSQYQHCVENIGVGASPQDWPVVDQWGGLVLYKCPAKDPNQQNKLYPVLCKAPVQKFTAPPPMTQPEVFRRSTPTNLDHTWNTAAFDKICANDVGPGSKAVRWTDDILSRNGTELHELFKYTRIGTDAILIYSDQTISVYNQPDELLVAEPGVIVDYLWDSHEGISLTSTPRNFGTGQLHSIWCKGLPEPGATMAPTPAPPTMAPTPAPPTMAPTLTASSKGDPHFRTWSGDKFDFHGGCDLVLFKNEAYDGKGIQINIRTKIETWWSYIESAVVKIGNSTLEVKGGPTPEDGHNYWLNGVAGTKLEDLDKSLTIEGFHINFQNFSSTERRFRINLGKDGAVGIEVVKDFVAVNVRAQKPEKFAGSVGLMGLYPSGEKVGRDGVTIFEDVNEFGNEWMVLDTEEMLFHTSEGVVQPPMKCAMPDETSSSTKKKRRLGESLMTEDEAILACLEVLDQEDEDFDHCVYDVLATNDKDMAGVY